MSKDWNPDVWQCPTCNDLVYSKSPGHYATCSCYANVTDNLGIAVDQTEYYTRLVGNMRAIYKGKLKNDS